MRLHAGLFAGLVLLISSSVALRAQPSQYAGAFLEIPVGSRALSMGGAYTALADDPTAFHYNAAGVALMDHKTVGFMYSSEFGPPGSNLASFWHLGYSMPLNNVTVAVNWVRLSVGDMLHTPDLTTIPVTGERQQLVRETLAGTGSYFSDNEDELVLTVAHNFKFTMDWGWLYYKHPVEIPVGISFKYIHQGIGNFGQSQGIGVDAGVMVRFSLGDFFQSENLGRVSFGISSMDMGQTRLTWSTERQQDVPSHIHGGVAYSQAIPFLGSTTTWSSDFLVGEASQMKWGMDFVYNETLAIRAGLNGSLFATGAGFKWEKKASLDYSLAFNPDLGPEHRLSFALDIDNILTSLSDAK